MMRRIRAVQVVWKFAMAMVAVVLMQGILAYKFRVFSYFDLPLICTVYYGFTLGNPVASIVMEGFRRVDECLLVTGALQIT